MKNEQRSRPARSQAFNGLDADQPIDVAGLNLTSLTRGVGLGYSVQFAMRAGELNAVWTPRPPVGRDARRVNDRYRTARHLFFEEVARRVGGNVACVELLS